MIPTELLGYRQLQLDAGPDERPLWRTCIEITLEKGMVKVVSPIDDTPAAKAGLQPEDYIAVDDESIIGLQLSEAVEKLGQGRLQSYRKCSVIRANLLTSRSSGISS